MYSVMTLASSDMNGLNHRWIGWHAFRRYAKSASEWAAGRLGIDPELISLGGNRKAYNRLKSAQGGKL